MKNPFLGTLYFKLFEAIQEEKQLRQNTEWPAGEQGKLANVRNDQKITDNYKLQNVLKELIDQCPPEIS